jgi:hypothetical protein
VTNIELTAATIAKLDLHEGDIIVVRVDGQLTPESHRQLASAFSNSGVANQVLLISSDVSIEILARADA